MPAHLNAYCVILAGGAGRRLWPASTPSRPKQLLPFASSRPLIDAALSRAVEIAGPERVRVVAPAPVIELMRPSLDAAGASALVEPVARGTGPALIWAASEIERADPGAVMISMHADHRIKPLAALRQTLEVAVERALEGYLCCVGVRPNRPETNFGYIETGRELAPGAFEAERFVEKPDQLYAEEYVESGRFLWNTGIFAWTAECFLQAARIHAREVRAGLPALDRGDAKGFFEAAGQVAVDVCVLERTGRVAAAEATFDWDDMGSWDALVRSREADEDGNIASGSVRLLDASDNVVWTENRRATVIGVRGLLIAEANGELLVMRRSEAGDIQTMVRELESEERPGERPEDLSG